MRRAAKVDSNQAEIVGALRQIGCSVQPMHMIGQGCPDILIGYRGSCLTAEIKDGSLRPSARRLTPMEKEWHESWRGHVSIINSVDEAIDMIARHGNWVLPPHRVIA